MPDISATEAARNFSDLLDGVEHRGEHFPIIRRGRPIARLEPPPAGRGAAVKAVLREHTADRAWARELEQVRELIQLDERP